MPMYGPPAVLSLDVGGSSVKSGVALADGSLLAGPFRTDIDARGPADGVAAGLAGVLTELHALAAGHVVTGIGVAMPGPFDYEAGVALMRGLGKFDSVYGLPLAAEVVAKAPLLARLPWHWVNDARAFALGELRFGAAAGAARAMFLTLGTGCGSAFAVDGSLVVDGGGVPEGGYVYRLPYGESIVDELVSGRGVARLWGEVARERAAAGGAEAGTELVSAERVAVLADAGDAVAIAVFARFGALLARSLASVFEAFGPDMVVVGGRVGRSLALFEPAARAAGAPPLVPPAAPDLAALRGAAAHFFDGVS